MNTGMILMTAIGSAALGLGLFGCFLTSFHEDKRRRDDEEIRRHLHQRWNA